MEKTNERKPKLQLVMQMMKHLVMKLTLKVLKAFAFVYLVKYSLETSASCSLNNCASKENSRFDC